MASIMQYLLENLYYDILKEFSGIRRYLIEKMILRYTKANEGY